jgi:polyisoprenoid-binding protein YceI
VKNKQKSEEQMKYKKLVGAIFVGLFLVSSAFSADKYNIDKSHTRIGFAVKHMLLSTVRGEFSDYSGTVIFDEKNVANSSVEGTVKVASISTNSEKRDNHLRSGDFFNAEKFPEIKFKSKKIIKDGSDYVMIADFTMRDVTKEIKVPFKVVGTITDQKGSKRIGIEAEFKINRKDYGVSWSRTMDNGGLVVSDEVVIELAFEGISKSKELSNR